MTNLSSRVESTAERTVDLSKSLIMVALVITAALAWNQSLGLILKHYAGSVFKNQGMYHLGFAVLVTVVVVVLSESFDMKARLPIGEGFTESHIEHEAMKLAEEAAANAGHLFREYGGDVGAAMKGSMEDAMKELENKFGLDKAEINAAEEAAKSVIEADLHKIHTVTDVKTTVRDAVTAMGMAVAAKKVEEEW